MCPAGAIAVAIFVTAAGLAAAARFLYRRKETFATPGQEDGRHCQKASEENTKECFI